MATNPLLKTKSLQSLLESLDMDQETKDKISSAIPQLAAEERQGLLDALTKLFIAERKEQESLSRIQRYWQE